MTPPSTNWLTDRERHIAQTRLLKDVGTIDNPDEREKSGSGLLHGVRLALTDLKVWFLMSVVPAKKTINFLTYDLRQVHVHYLPHGSIV
jgi:hypothetical protein